jgi:hypothetical protein
VVLQEDFAECAVFEIAGCGDEWQTARLKRERHVAMAILKAAAPALRGQSVFASFRNVLNVIGTGASAAAPFPFSGMASGDLRDASAAIRTIQALDMSPESGFAALPFPIAQLEEGKPLFFSEIIGAANRQAQECGNRGDSIEQVSRKVVICHWVISPFNGSIIACLLLIAMLSCYKRLAK